RLDEATYEKAIKVTDVEIANVNIDRHAFHGDRNTRSTQPEFRSSRGLWARLRPECPYEMGVSGVAGARKVDFA
ncbi:MAG: hypothetical protein LC790_16350, partial [Actinobacteria bacterium]|nr:hypothetical protein [Actinomycetota bacterium]